MKEPGQQAHSTYWTSMGAAIGWHDEARHVRAAWAAVEAACRAEGMRKAARINQDLARKYHGVGQEAWATVLWDGADAIISAIGDSQ